MANRASLCYLRNVFHKDLSVYLPDNFPVVIGRMPELKIIDKTCSRNQLELRANYEKRYVLVKRLGSNPSYIDGIEIQRDISSKLNPGQKLFIINMKFPHCITFEKDDAVNEGNFIQKQTKQKSSSNELTKKDEGFMCEVQRKRTIVSQKENAKSLKITQSNYEENTQSTTTNSEYEFSSPLKDDKKYFKTSVKTTSSSNHWSQGLKAAMSDLKSVVFKDETVVAIRDKYPKAKFHWLVLPREDISNFYRLQSKHVNLLKHMLQVGKTISERESIEDDSITFRFGYHAVASMSQLHMHVISQDFASPCLKTKKHWNSFTTDYFVDAQVIINELEKNNEVKDRKSYTKLLNEPLRCHRCKDSQKNMPTLKQHLLSCPNDG